MSLAGLANERFLESLGDEMRELKSLLAGLAPKIDGLADGRLKALVQDLSRFAREARENYASAIGKAAFRERIEDAAERALNIWRDAVERTDAARQPLETLSKSPRFGEVQVEKALALMRALHEQKRIQEISARTLAAAHTLRLAVGDSVARRAGRSAGLGRGDVAGRHRAGPRSVRPPGRLREGGARRSLRRQGRVRSQPRRPAQADRAPARRSRSR